MIDWTKPLELIDGTPIILENPETSDFISSNPDKDGHYWFHYDDDPSEKILFNDFKLSYVCVDPKNELEAKLIRNRKEVS